MISNSKYTIIDASTGLGKTFQVAESIVEMITAAMQAVEVAGVLKGDAKKQAVFSMIQGLISNFDEVKDALSKLIDMVKTIYNQVKQLIQEIF